MTEHAPRHEPSPADQVPQEVHEAAAPTPGWLLGREVERYGADVRCAVDILTDTLAGSTLAGDFAAIFAARWGLTSAAPSAEPLPVRAAWALVNVWLLAAHHMGPRERIDLAAAERWFLGATAPRLPSLAARVAPRAAGDALRALWMLPIGDDLWARLPYLVDPHGPGSRLSVRRDPGTRTAREAKRKAGVFYTPADVADYIVAAALDARGPTDAARHVLDPACGTGVFLVAYLRRVLAGAVPRPSAFLVASRRIHGFDRSDLAVETAAFVLLHECLHDALTQTPSPWSAWQLLRLNLVAVDTVTVAPPAVAPPAVALNEERRVRHAAVRDALLAGDAPPPVSEPHPTPDARRAMWASLTAATQSPTAVNVFFPDVSNGFDLMIGNPPYAALDLPALAASIRDEYESLRGLNGTRQADVYPLFVEMMWRLTRTGHSGAALVVPLSIAYSQDAQLRACRAAMVGHGGVWRCAFFDREPHALFGEDVKTRNAILVRAEGEGLPLRGCPAEISTGPLRRWTSRTRSRLFASIAFTSLRGTDIVGGIQKLDGEAQMEAFAKLSRRHDRLASWVAQAGIATMADAVEPVTVPQVFVAGTAYNFLNVFRSIVPPHGETPLSENGVSRFRFATEDDAAIVFAIAASRLTFWLWHVSGDAFHVTLGFLQSLPFGRGSFDATTTAALATAGRRLWLALQEHRIVSLNRGRQTVAFRPLACQNERDEIDRILVHAAGLDPVFPTVLRAFERGLVVVDETDVRRAHLHSYFTATETPPR